MGHPSSIIVDRVIRDNNLSFSRESSLAVCDACQQAKSHQLPYPKSTSVSSYPLELIFSDVWGPAPQSVGRYQYYVSFIDDFSKFTWIYLLRNRSEVFQVFLFFKFFQISNNMLSVCLIERLLLCKLIGAVNIKN